MQIIELNEASNSSKKGDDTTSERDILKQERKKIARYVRQDAHVVVLTANGQKKTTLQLAKYLENLRVRGQSKVDFIIGGPLGLSEEIEKKGDLCLSLSSLTFPHRLARLILLEQLYRCFKIIKGEPYHR